MVSKRISMISVLFSCLLLLVVAVVFYRLPYVSITSDRLVFTPLEISLDTLDFAGERVETDPLHNPLGRDKLERELLVTHFSLYQFLLYHRLSGRYFPYMTSFFREVGVPDDFKYLAVAESGLDVTAESRVGARGLWQLMPETAKRYGLIVNDQIDERYDFEKSTRVAAKHILVLYKLFDNNWTLAAAAYNR